MKQIGLDFGFLPDYSLENYYVANPDVSPLNILLCPEIWGNHALLICGEKGAGKTHLCYIYANTYNVPLVQGKDLNLDNLPELASAGCVVDGIETADETMVFHLLNMAKEFHTHVVVSSQISLNNVQLPDLHSRLCQAMRITLDLPNDDVLSTVLLKQFADRNLRLSSDVMSYIMPRMPRSYSGVALLVQVLDETALESKVNITIPFVRKILSDFNQGL